MVFVTVTVVKAKRKDSHLANQSKSKYLSEPIRIRSKKGNPRQARETFISQVTGGLGLADWLKQQNVFRASGVSFFNQLREATLPNMARTGFF